MESNIPLNPVPPRKEPVAEDSNADLAVPASAVPLEVPRGIGRGEEVGKEENE